MTSTIPPVPQPEFGAWISARRLSNRAVGELIGVGPQQVARYCLPFEDPRRQVPRDEVLQRIVTCTRGEITALNFYPPNLRPQPVDASGRGGDPEVLHRARAM